MKKYFSLFYKRSSSFYFIIILMGILNSALNSLFMIIVSKSITDTGFFIFKGLYPLLFFVLLIACVVVNVLFNSYITRLSTGIINEIELDLVKKIQAASYYKISRIGSEEIYSALRNIGSLGEAPGRFIYIFISFLTALGCVIYLFTISYMYGFIISGLIALLIYNYFFRGHVINDKFRMIRELRTDYYKQLGDLLNGHKDIKMSSTKGKNFYSNFILKNRKVSSDLIIKLKHKLSQNSLITNYTWYFFLGIVLFVLPKWAQMGLYNPSVFAVIMVYILGPVTTINSFFPFIAELKVAYNGLEAINAKLAMDEDIEPEEISGKGLDDFRNLTFRDIYFEHTDEDHGKMFSLGPVNLQFEAGEVVFLVGGNGSGKTTFLHILTGLQKPLTGSIYYNNELLHRDDYVAYRDKMAAVFSEPYLLRNNYEEFEINDQNESFVKCLKLMKLDAIAGANELFERKSLLSKGQQKRFALILSLLMNKQILVWDELTADQDPVFKEFFYRHVVPILRKEGKTIIAISHDDQYLSCADRVIRFRDGKVAEQFIPETSQVFNSIK